MEDLRTELTSTLHNRRPCRAAHLLAYFFIAASSLTPSVLQAQTNAEVTVKSAMTKDEHGMCRAYDSVFAKWLPRFGDASAVALTKLLADKPIADADIPAIVIIVSNSYDSPVSIEDTVERQPRTTLYLLRSLLHETRDLKNISLIEEAAGYVKSQYAAYLKNRRDQ